MRSGPHCARPHDARARPRHAQAAYGGSGVLGASYYVSDLFLGTLLAHSQERNASNRQHSAAITLFISPL